MLTSRYAMDLVLNEEVDQRHQHSEERPSKDLSIFDSDRILRTQHQTANSPRESCNQVRNHKDIMPVMVICRSYVCPSTTCERSEDASA